MDEVAKLKDTIQVGEAGEKRLDDELRALLAAIPNNPASDVPVGPDANANKVLRVVGDPPKFSFPPKQHFELGEALGLMDFETAAKLSGARFVVLKGALARLERALAAFMLDLHTSEHGYTEVAPPLLVRDDTMFGTAQLPKFWTNQFESYPGDVYKHKLKQNFSSVGLAALQLAKRYGIVEAREKIVEATGFEEAGYDKDRRWLIPTAEVPLTNLVR